MLEIIAIIAAIVIAIAFWWLTIPAAIILMMVIFPDLLKPAAAIIGVIAINWILGYFFYIDGMDVKLVKRK